MQWHGSCNEKVMRDDILHTAFYKAVVDLEEGQRAEYFLQCGKESGELYFELAEYYNEYHPKKLSALIEKLFHVKHYRIVIEKITQNGKDALDMEHRFKLIEGALEIERRLSEKGEYE